MKSFSRSRYTRVVCTVVGQERERERQYKLMMANEFRVYFTRRTAAADDDDSTESCAIERVNAHQQRAPGEDLITPYNVPQERERDTASVTRLAIEASGNEKEERKL